MAAETSLMNNIFSVVQILRQANSPSVACWDESTLLNAFKWTNYCEVLCKACQGRKFSPELSAQVSRLTLYLDPPSCLHLDLGALVEASQILTKSLLQNPYCSSVLFECLFTYSLNRGSSTVQQRLKDRQTMCRESQMLRGVKPTFLPDDHHEMNRPPDQPSYMARVISDHAVLLSQHLQRMSRLCASVEGTDADHTLANRFSRHVDRLLLMLSNAEHGWDVILETLLLLTDPRPEDSHNVHQSVASAVQECVVSNTRPESADHMSCRVWSCDAQLLVQVAEISPDFCNHYLTYLTQLADRFTIHYSPPGSLPPYTWKCGTDEMMTIERLKHHLTSLVSSPSSSNFRHRITDFLRQMLAQTSEPSIWRDLCPSKRRGNIL